MNPHQMFASVLSVFALGGSAQAQDDATSRAIEETHGGRGERGNRHGKGFDEVLRLKGEPLAPRFPRFGEGIERHVLDNGLVVVLAQDKTLPLIEMELTIRAGEAYETEALRGLCSAMIDRVRRGGIAAARPTPLPPLTPENEATYAEDTAPDVTTDAKAVDERFAAMATQVGGRAGIDSANFTLNALAANFDESFRLFVDLVLRPAMVDPPENDGPRGGGFGGFGGGRGGRGPQQQASSEFRRIVYGEDHPLAREGFGGRGFGGPGGPGGPEGGAGPGGRRGPRFERSQLIDAYLRFVRPDQSFLMVVGDFESAPMLERIRGAFGGWSKPDEPPAPREDKAIPAIAGKGPGVYVIDVKTPQSAIVIGHLGVDRNTPDRFAIALMNDVLGGGSFTSRITERVRSDEGLAYSAGSSFPVDGRQPGLFQASVQTKTESTARAIELILEEIKRIREPGSISTNEFATARESRLYSSALAYSDRGRNVARLIQRELEGRPTDLDETEFRALQAVTIADLEAAAQKYLDPDQLVICVAGDLEKIRDSLSKFGEIHVVPPRGRGGRRDPPGGGR
jgi:zinc protease